MKKIVFIFLLATAAIPGYPSEINWKILEMVKGGRIDAIVYLGHGMVLAGTRNPNPAIVFRSKDFGLSWGKVSVVYSEEERKGITCLESGGNGICYLLNESSEFFRSVDYGETWERTSRLSNGYNKDGYALSYGICVTKLGTVLVSETNSEGASVFRSTDQGISFKRVGPVSEKPLYRFTVLGNSVIINGWEGAVFRSEDDGLSWKKWNVLDSSALFATEYIGAGSYIQGSEAGNLYMGSQYADERYRLLGKIGDAADDLAYLGYGTIIYSTYTGSRSVFISYDSGTSWINDGAIPTNSGNDWLDHVIKIDKADSVIALGGTNKGFIARASLSREYLYHKTFDRQKYSYDKSLIRQIEKGLKGAFTDYTDLDEPEDVLIDGKFAYVPCRGSGNLVVIDISDPANPFLASSFKDTELVDAMGLDKKDQYIYLTSMSNYKCLVLDASDPTKIKKVYSFSVGSDATPYSMLRKVIYENGYLYLTRSCEGTLYIADARNPARPVIISRIETGDGAFAVLVKGDYAYSGGCPGSSIKVIDIKDKLNPKVVKTLFDPRKYNCTCSFRYIDNDLFAIAYSSNSFIVLDISDPVNIKQKGFLQTNQMYGPNRLSLIGSKAYVINSINDSFAEVDISDSTSPKINYIVPSRLLEKVYGMATKEGLLYMVGRDSRSFVIVDPNK